ncbi:MAG: PDZ domain-containing protein [Gemmatimonadota bacterium]|nr:PDZ domain-containing protein [Gemmatimonadota bacterium]MDE2870682.1 PDZ domain-containing protein [Gemmatimonadota bacterium]
MTRFTEWGRLAALALVAVPAWTAVGAAQEEEEESYPIVRYYENEMDTRPILGVYVETMGRSGLRVTRVMEDWPAEAAGIRRDDIIVRIDGRELAEPLEDEAKRGLPIGGSLRERRLRALLKEVPEGEAVEVTVRRDGETLNLTVVPRAWPEQVVLEHAETLRELGARLRTLEIPERLSASIRFPPRSYEFRLGGRWQGGHGLDLLELNPELGSYFGTEEGVLVADVDDDSTLGLRPGDVIVAVDGRRVGDIAKLDRILSSYEDDEEIRFRIWRDGAETTATGTIS